MEAPLPRLIFAALATALLSAPLAAAPLCRDTRGLFTPCPRDANRRIVKSPVDQAAGQAREEERKTARVEKRAKHRVEHPAEPEKPELISRGKLCRDGKGLFTPCPR